MISIPSAPNDMHGVRRCLTDLCRLYNGPLNVLPSRSIPWAWLPSGILVGNFGSGSPAPDEDCTWIEFDGVRAGYYDMAAYAGKTIYLEVTSDDLPAQPVMTAPNSIYPWDDIIFATEDGWVFGNKITVDGKTYWDSYKFCALFENLPSGSTLEIGMNNVTPAYMLTPGTAGNYHLRFKVMTEACPETVCSTTVYPATPGTWLFCKAQFRLNWNGFSEYSYEGHPANPANRYNKIVDTQTVEWNITGGAHVINTASNISTCNKWNGVAGLVNGIGDGSQLFADASIHHLYYDDNQYIREPGNECEDTTPGDVEISIFSAGTEWYYTTEAEPEFINTNTKQIEIRRFTLTVVSFTTWNPCDLVPIDPVWTVVATGSITVTSELQELYTETEYDANVQRLYDSVSHADMAGEILKLNSKNWTVYYDGAGVIRRLDAEVVLTATTLTSFQEVRKASASDLVYIGPFGKMFQGLKVAFNDTYDEVNHGVLTLYKADLDVSMAESGYLSTWINNTTEDQPAHTGTVLFVLESEVNTGQSITGLLQVDDYAIPYGPS